MDSARRLEMPPFPKERFLEAVDQVVRGPSCSLGTSIPGLGHPLPRASMFATGPVIGLKPLPEVPVQAFGTPGRLPLGRAKPLTLYVIDS